MESNLPLFIRRNQTDPERMAWFGGHLLIFGVISSPPLLHLSPPPTPYPSQPPLLLSKLGWDWKLLCDCQRWQIPCPTVLLSVCLLVYLCVRPYEGLSWGLNCAAVKHVGRIWSPHSCGICSERTKKMTKKILVVYNLNCFHGFVSWQEQRRSSGSLRAWLLYAVGEPYDVMTKPTNRMEDGRWNMHCTVLYWNILHEASILTIKVETFILLIFWECICQQMCSYSAFYSFPNTFVFAIST